MEELHRLADVAQRARVIAHLAELVVLAARLDQLAALEEVMPERLLDVGVFPRLDRPDAGEEVPVVRGRDRDRIDRLVLEQLPQVLVVDRFLPRRLLDLGDRGGDDVLVRVADRRDLHVRQREPAAHVDHALAVDADDGDADFVVGADPAARFGRERGQTAGQGRGGEKGLLQEFPATELGHGVARPQVVVPQGIPLQYGRTTTRSRGRRRASGTPASAASKPPRRPRSSRSSNRT